MQQYPELKRNINNRDFYEPAVEEEGARRGILPSIEVECAGSNVYHRSIAFIERCEFTSVPYETYYLVLTRGGGMYVFEASALEGSISSQLDGAFFSRLRKPDDT